MKKVLIFILSLFFIFPVVSVGYTAEQLPARTEQRLGQPTKILHAEHVQDKGISFKGCIVVSARIDEDGNAISASIMVSSGRMVLDRIACRIVMERWKFAPALDDNSQPMISNIICPVYFNMKPTRKIQ